MEGSFWILIDALPTLRKLCPPVKKSHGCLDVCINCAHPWKSLMWYVCIRIFAFYPCSQHSLSSQPNGKYLGKYFYIFYILIIILIFRVILHTTPNWRRVKHSSAKLIKILTLSPNFSCVCTNTISATNTVPPIKWCCYAGSNIVIVKTC